MARQAADDDLGDCKRIHIIGPLEVFDCHNFEAKSFLILRDCGGIQEEAPAYGVPVLVTRDTTERSEGVDDGTLKLAGTSEEVICEEFTRLLDDKNASSKMAKLLTNIAMTMRLQTHSGYIGRKRVVGVEEMAPHNAKLGDL